MYKENACKNCGKISASNPRCGNHTPCPNCDTDADLSYEEEPKTSPMQRIIKNILILITIILCTLAMIIFTIYIFTLPTNGYIVPPASKQISEAEDCLQYSSHMRVGDIPVKCLKYFTNCQPSKER